MSDFLGFPPDAVAVVTGAASGIGRAVADLLSVSGVAVAGWDVSVDGVADWVAGATAGTPRTGVVVDVTRPAEVATAWNSTATALGPTSFLVNCAGPPSTEDLAIVEGLAVSVGSVASVTDAWLETPGSSGGSVVNIASVAGTSIGGAGTRPWYPAAKAGILGYTRHLAVTRPAGIRANVVAPGIVATPRTSAGLRAGPMVEIVRRNPMGRAGAPSEVAAAVVFLLAPVSAYVNGVLLPVDGGSILTL